jgi:hypothetical protein
MRTVEPSMTVTHKYCDAISGGELYAVLGILFKKNKYRCAQAGSARPQKIEFVNPELQDR